MNDLPNNVAFINMQRLQLSMERFLITKNAKLSDLFIVVWSSEEAEFEKELDDNFLKTLISNIWDKDPKFDFLARIDTRKIKVFFSKKCKVLECHNGQMQFMPKQYLLDHRKYEYPKVSVPSMRPFIKIGNSSSNIN